jgi:mannosylglycoprotein endo-beta-mannosidase
VVPIKKKKITLLNRLDDLDKKAETGVLSKAERDLKHFLNERLAELHREEELKWYQRAKVKHLFEGDANTKYYHLLANGRHRNSRIFQLEDGNGIITGDAQLKEHITRFYKNMFGPSEESTVVLDESQTEDIPQVLELESEFLVAPFSQEEVREAIFQMNHNKAP